MLVLNVLYSYEVTDIDQDCIVFFIRLSKSWIALKVHSERLLSRLVEDGDGQQSNTSNIQTSIMNMAIGINFEVKITFVSP